MHSPSPHRRAELLREIFLNASLIAAMKEVAEELAQIEQIARHLDVELEPVSDAPAPAA